MNVIRKEFIVNASSLTLHFARRMAHINKIFKGCLLILNFFFKE